MILKSPQRFNNEHKNTLEALNRLWNDNDFEDFLSYLEDEKNNIAFDSCNDNDHILATKKQGAVIVLHELINRAREARNTFNKIQERMKKQ